MEQKEIRDLLEKMSALRAEGEKLDPIALMVDPIVTNRLAVELLQQVDREWKPEFAVAPVGCESYFGYSVALAAWMRFSYAEPDDSGFALPNGFSMKKKEKTLIVLEDYDKETAGQLVEMVQEGEGRVRAILCICSHGVSEHDGIPVLSLL